MSTLPFSINPNNIHQGPGNPWMNVPVPATGSRLEIGANGAPTLGAAWVASTTYLAGSQVVDSAGNLQRAVNSGTSGSTAPTWATAIGGTVSDGTTPTAIVWECVVLGQVYYAGAIEGATTVGWAPKNEGIMADQVAGPVDCVTVSAEATIEVEMQETDMLHMANWFSGGIYGAGTDAGLPTGEQNYQELSFGGILVIPKLSLAVISPRRNNANKYVVSQLYKCFQMEQVGFAVTREKKSMVKMKFTGLFDPTRPQGDQAGKCYWMI
jgi:hypothetical protein